MASEQFARAEVHTSWLDEHADQLETVDDQLPLVAAALFIVESSSRGRENDPFGTDGWRPGGPAAATRLTLSEDGERHDVLVARQADQPRRPFRERHHDTSRSTAPPGRSSYGAPA